VGGRVEREAGGNESSPDCWLFGFGFGLCLLSGLQEAEQEEEEES